MRSNFWRSIAGAATLAFAAAGLAGGARAGGHGGGASGAGGHWASGSAFGPGLGRHWIPAPRFGGRGAGYGGGFGLGPRRPPVAAPPYGGEGRGGYVEARPAYGVGFSGRGVWYGPRASYGGYAHHRYGLYPGYVSRGGFRGGYLGGAWGGGGVYYPDPAFDYGYGFDYGEGKPAAYDGLTGLPPGFYAAPTYARGPIGLYESPTVIYKPRIVNVAAAGITDEPHVIYLRREPRRLRQRPGYCARAN